MDVRFANGTIPVDKFISVSGDAAFNATQLAQLEEVVRRVVHAELAAHEEAQAAQRLEQAGVEYEEYLKAKGKIVE